MKLIQAEYDGYNRTFKLLNTNDAHKLRDGGTYMFMDLTDDDLKQDLGPGCPVSAENDPAW